MRVLWLGCVVLFNLFWQGPGVALGGSCLIDNSSRYHLAADVVEWSMNVVSGKTCTGGLRFANVILHDQKLVSPPQAGEVTLRGAGFAYTPRLGFQGQDSFAIEISGSIGKLRGVSTVNVMVLVGDVPTRIQTQGRDHQAAQLTATPGTRTAPASAAGPVVVKVDAASTVVLPGQKILLTAKVVGATDQTVTWNVQEGAAGGSIVLSSIYPDAQRNGPQWVYTAPNTPGTYHVLTTAAADTANPVTTALTVQLPVTGCSTTSADIGIWKNITPPQVDLTTGDFFGMQAMVVDPTNPSTVYVGRAMDGIYKSTDCGANWTKTNTGRNARLMASGRNWSMVIDPNNPQVIYANQGYGVSGLFKTTNGGVDWDQVLTPNVTSVAPYGGFVGGISMDPNDSRHLLVGWHADCLSPHRKACFAETRDGGITWAVRDGDPSWVGGEWTGYQIIDDKIWIFYSESNGLWSSSDGGGSWQRVSGASVLHGHGQLYRDKNGSFYFGTAHGILHSVDGVRWAMLPNSGNSIMGLIGDGTTLYASNAFPYNPPGAEQYLPYISAAEGASSSFTRLNSPMMRNGGAELHLDPVRHILYSTNLNAGLWRMVTR